MRYVFHDRKLFSLFGVSAEAGVGAQIDIDGALLSLRYPIKVNIVGDSAATLRALLPLLVRNSNTAWRRTIKKNVAKWWKLLEERAMVPADPINPQRVF